MIYNLGNKIVLYLIWNLINGFVVVLNGKVEQPALTQTGNWANNRLVLHVRLRVARCQSQHQCHLWQMSTLFEARCTGKWAWQLSIIFMPFMRLWTVAKIWRFIEGLLRKCKYVLLTYRTAGTHPKKVLTLVSQGSFLRHLSKALQTQDKVPDCWNIWGF